MSGYVRNLALAAREAQAAIAACDGATRRALIEGMAARLQAGQAGILAANADDMMRAAAAGAGKATLVDEHSLQKLEEDFATVQSDLLDQMLDQVQRQEFRFRMHMVGLRENDRVVVYNR